MEGLARGGENGSAEASFADSGVAALTDVTLGRGDGEGSAGSYGALRGGDPIAPAAAALE